MLLFCFSFIPSASCLREPRKPQKFLGLGRLIKGSMPREPHWTAAGLGLSGAGLPGGVQRVGLEHGESDSPRQHGEPAQAGRWSSCSAPWPLCGLRSRSHFLKPDLGVRAAPGPGGHLSHGPAQGAAQVHLVRLHRSGRGEERQGLQVPAQGEGPSGPGVAGGGAALAPGAQEPGGDAARMELSHAEAQAWGREPGPGNRDVATGWLLLPVLWGSREVTCRAFAPKPAHPQLSGGWR